MNGIKRVAVVDDVPDAALAIIHALEDAEIHGFLVDQCESSSALVDLIVSTSDAAIFDHRLSYGGFADVTGAELAAMTIDRGHPAILVTQYMDQEADVSIRKYRRILPSVLRRQDADEPSEILAAFERCISEMSQGPRGDRTPQRTLINVQDVVNLGVEETVVDATIHGWKTPKSAVRFPVSIIPEELRADVVPGAILAVVTNIQADSQGDLYFRDFELVPDFDPEDGLG
ncbi:hypothetical protein HGQ62_11695 [Stenotrophomonas maltophilia]|nr:hypothetical protein [Stenotrophomonas maltophilia]NMT72965.1 hypothetical protein [Stenotrophomonas maltophilia]